MDNEVILDIVDNCAIISDPIPEGERMFMVMVFNPHNIARANELCSFVKGRRWQTGGVAFKYPMVLGKSGDTYAEIKDSLIILIEKYK